MNESGSPVGAATSPAAPRPARGLTPTTPSPAAPDIAGVELGQALSPLRRAGTLLITVFLGGFLAWGMLVPLAGGAVAPGVISPDGSRRTVQHLEGGIIAGIQVRDGDRVTEGQPLVLLESLQARTTYNALLNQYHTLLATQARLRAEQAGKTEIEFPAELRENPDPEIRTILEGQRFLLATRNAAHDARRSVQRQRIEQSQEQIRALQAQVSSALKQLALIADELKGKEELLRGGLVPRPEILRLQRVEAEILGRWGEHTAMIARTQQLIGETELQILAGDAERADKIADQLDKVRTELATVTERLQASRDVLARTVVTAPISGKVVGLRFKTLEGVIRPGEAILDIVPDEEMLLIDAHVAPGDIDVVHAGLPAQVRLTAFSSRGLPRIMGTVRDVSADRLQEPSNGQPYYLARVEVSREELAQLGPAADLVPGMPAEVLIVRTERTMIDYLFEPLRVAFGRSFREA
ncbi:HlyD family type I secretion periplasmic adaptor subunit [Siccirubricoccus sp. KC 17139]|uniref:Membrane fusion protein (MFP) family protein n=1 Tax=Siccirubricoccus soli TaxID=2899147 RepID=A0ABT1DFK2_9PROT|nr:HlyD family type I secretion periplasmic adaptor subunit [Siccirubricoccus soli]MCO6419730.1 HlyD family type I secretion periplasmic adaptor subunit [Siccirubricoccus soli]MCP2685865.1 HlyD family type I secretion periplasmic adaptor subunit [Siccirubricoccus soli]